MAATQPALLMMAATLLPDFRVCARVLALLGADGADGAVDPDGVVLVPAAIVVAEPFVPAVDVDEAILMTGGEQVGQGVFGEFDGEDEVIVFAVAERRLGLATRPIFIVRAVVRRFLRRHTPSAATALSLCPARPGGGAGKFPGPALARLSRLPRPWPRSSASACAAVDRPSRGASLRGRWCRRRCGWVRRQARGATRLRSRRHRASMTWRTMRGTSRSRRLRWRRPPRRPSAPNRRTARPDWARTPVPLRPAPDRPVARACLGRRHYRGRCRFRP